jgi:hypothetical protein
MAPNMVLIGLRMWSTSLERRLKALAGSYLNEIKTPARARILAKYKVTSIPLNQLSSATN